MPLSSPDFGLAKSAAARAALRLVKEDMVLGLGSGTTSAVFVQLLAQRVESEHISVTCVATSSLTEQLAKSLGLNVVPLSQVDRLDLAVDGADQVDKQRRLIKGHGGALTREKIVEYSARRFVCIADWSKESHILNKPIPVEFLPFAQRTVGEQLRRLGAQKIEMMHNAQDLPFVSDNGFWIMHCDFGPVKNPSKLEASIQQIPGVLECGLFSRPADLVILGLQNGKTKILGK